MIPWCLYIWGEKFNLQNRSTFLWFLLISPSLSPSSPSSWHSLSPVVRLMSMETGCLQKCPPPQICILVPGTLFRFWSRTAVHDELWQKWRHLSRCVWHWACYFLIPPQTAPAPALVISSLNFNFVLKYNWLAVLWWFPVDSQGAQPYVDPFSSKVPCYPHEIDQRALRSTAGPCGLFILNIAVCAWASQTP